MTQRQRNREQGTASAGPGEGTGVVAEGVVFATGKVVLSWCSEYHSVTMYDAIVDLVAIHGHQGSTRVDWLDPAHTTPTALSPRL